MPNWIEGTMKLRGKMSDIKHFIDERICGYDFTGEFKHPKNVDIRLFGIECGMEFIQEVIVHHGHDSEKAKIVLNNCIQFEDWAWECPFPEMGG